MKVMSSSSGILKAGILAAYYFLNCWVAKDVFSVYVTLPMFILCLYGVSTTGAKYLVLDDMLWLCAYLFFVIGPCQALSEGYFEQGSPVYGIYFSPKEIVSAMTIAMLFFLFLLITRKKARRQAVITRHIEIAAKDMPLLLVANIFAFGLYVIFSGGLGNVMASRFDRDLGQISVLALPGLAMQIVLTFLIAVLASSQEGQRRLLVLFSLGVSLVLLAVSQNPFNAPRYFLMAAWMPLIFIMLGGRVKAGVFYLAVFFGILFVMPVVSLTSRFGTGIGEAIGNVNVAEDIFRLPYIDVFDMLCYEVQYMADKGYYWGGKMLGMLLFFVPRSFWQDKASLLALDMGEELLYYKIAGTENLSLFMAGDLYADFGYFGSILGGIVVGVIFKKFFDKRKTFINNQNLSEYIIIAALPILMRGPLGANAPLTFVEFLVLGGIVFVFYRKKIINDGVNVNFLHKRSV